MTRNSCPYFGGLCDAETLCSTHPSELSDCEVLECVSNVPPTKDSEKSVQEEIKDFSLRAAGRLFHLMTGKEATCKVAEGDFIYHKVPFSESLYTFEIWVNSGDRDCCVEGGWSGKTHSPTDFSTSIISQGPLT